MGTKSSLPVSLSWMMISFDEYSVSIPLPSSFITVLPSITYTSRPFFSTAGCTMPDVLFTCLSTCAFEAAIMLSMSSCTRLIMPS